MLQVHTSHDPFLKQLLDEEFEVEVCGGYLIVHHVPYLNTALEIKSGTLVMHATMAGDILTRPKDHTAYFIGESPCNTNGRPLPSLVNGPQRQALTNGLYSNFFLSCHPVGREYSDFYDKVTTYWNTITAPAYAHNPDKCDSIRQSIIIKEDTTSPLRYMDTNASRCNISMLNDCYKGIKVAIVGLGGTGSYILDFVAKTGVQEIHLYDSDVFCTHNAYRAPGAPDEDILRSRPKKVDYLKGVYEKLHSGIITHPERIMPDNLMQLDIFDYVFICVDGDIRTIIAEYLSKTGKAFVDSGIGMEITSAESSQLMGAIRVTPGEQGHFEHLTDDLPKEGLEEDLYTSNIQIAEINALAAILSVIQWKKHLGYYHSAKFVNNFVFDISTNDSYCKYDKDS